MGGLKILITNSTLSHRCGTELYVRDIALGLLARGHSPVAFSTTLGEVARELRRGNVPVVDDLDALDGWPDIIHGHHHLETTIASLRFPNAPVISFCHGVAPWEELPAQLPTVLRYVAVDLPCRDRLVRECGVPAEKVSLLFNFVDLKRFGRRGPLPDRPRRALVFSNAASEQTQLPSIRKACARRGIALDVAGLATRALEAPEETLGQYDLVFAKARAAMEAMASGCAVVLCDSPGAGPMVTSGEFERLRELNFGLRALLLPLRAEQIGSQIDRFDAADATHVRDLMRANGDMERRLDELLELYATVLGAARSAPDPDALTAAAGRYLQSLLPRIKSQEFVEEMARVHREPGLRLQVALSNLPIAGRVVRALGRRIFGSSRPHPD